MANNRKIDYAEVKKLRDDGLKVTEIAARFDVSKGAISKALRKMNVPVAALAVEQGAPSYIGHLDNEITQLYELFKRVSDQLEWISKNVSKAADEDYRLWDDNYRKHLAEARKLLKEVSDTKYKAFKGIQVVELFNTIDEAIADESIETQKRIAKRIKRRLGIGIPRAIN